MKYNSPYEIGIGDVVIMTDDTGYKTEHLVLINYIKGETDAKGYTCLLYTSPSPRDSSPSRMPSSA